jgi:hypothetical protein
MCVAKTYPFAIQENWRYAGNSGLQTVPGVISVASE